MNIQKVKISQSKLYHLIQILILISTFLRQLFFDLSLKHERFPKNSGDSEWQCASYGRDVCTIHHSNVTKGDIFYMGVTCPSGTCNIQLVTLQSNEFQLEDGVEFQAYLDTNEARIFKFTIPQDIKDESHLIIKGSAYRGSAHDFGMSVNLDAKKAGGLPSSNIDNKKGIPAWKRGQVIRLQKEDFPNQQWCRGCELKILVDATDAGYYHVMAQTSDAILKMHNNEQIDDIVGFSQTQCYEYYVKRGDTDFQVTLTTYSGRVTVKAHPGSIPDKWEDFAMTADQDIETILDIRAWGRRHRFNQTDGKYYVCVKGEITSTYSIKVREFELDNTHTELEDGYSEYFFLWRGATLTHSYRVPKLEYKGEDIKVEIDLIIKHGDQPILAAAFCDKDEVEECRKEATLENINMPNSKFQKATMNGQILKLLIDHDEIACNSQDKDCYYIIAVINTNQNSGLRYKIQASHNQNNHILLQERTPKIDSVQMQSYKYYKFTIPIQDKQTIQNISIEINPLHGDADLLISRTEEFPTKEHYERKSARVGSLVDHVTYSLDENNTVLEGTYFIGVYGYSYSTYSIIVNVNRSKHDKIDDAMASSVMLYQGIPYTKTIKSITNTLSAYFNVAIDENDNFDIIFDVQQLEHKVDTYIRYGEMPNSKSYDFHVKGSGTIQIPSTDKKYHKNGVYFVTVVPDGDFLDLFRDKHYAFTLQWRTMNMVPHLNSQGIMQLQTPKGKISYLRHYVVDNEQDIRISLSTRGQQDLFVIADPNKKEHTLDTADFSTKLQKGQNFDKGKTLLIPIDKLKALNNACLDLGFASDEPCMLNIGIYCMGSEDCTSSIELEYDTKMPKRVFSGQMKHNILQNDSFAYYYMVIQKEEQLQDVFAVLQPLSGRAYMVYNVQRIKNDESDTDLKGLVSKTKLKSEMIHVPREEQEQCFKLANDEVQAKVDIECHILFGIFPTADNDQEHIIYNFAAYSGMLELHNKQPMVSKVRAQEFVYFLYHQTCVTCSMIVSLTGTTSDGVELYINKGTRRPTVIDYDIMKTFGSTHIITINLSNTPYFKSNNIQSMADYYVFGIYGIRDTSFQISITSEDQPIATITEGVAVTHSQKPNELSYFQYYHWDDGNDIEIEVQVSQGSVDLLVSTFNPRDDDLVDRLPSKAMKAQWMIEEITPLNFHAKRLIILSADRHYCSDCYYLIGVRTGSDTAMYSVNLKSKDPKKDYSHLLRVGDTKMVKLNSPEETQIFQFMLETNDPASIIPTRISGNVVFYLGYTPNIYESFLTQSNFDPIRLSKDQIKADENYYLIVAGASTTAELTIQLQQTNNYVTLHDGVPQSVFFENYNDATKNLIFNLPPGNHTVMFSLRSKTKGFFPNLFISLNELNDKGYYDQSKQFSFHPFWDRDQYMLQVARRFTNVPENAEIKVSLRYLSTIFNDSNWSQEGVDSSASVVLTLSYSQTVKLQPNEEFFGTLHSTQYSFQMFKIDPPKNRTVKVTYSACVGMPQFSLTNGSASDTISTKKVIKLNPTRINGREVALVQGLDDGGEYYIMVESLKMTLLDEELEYQSEFTVKVDYVGETPDTLFEKYLPANGGKIDWEPLKYQRGYMRFTWKPVVQTRYIGPSDTARDLDVTYKLVYTTNTHVNLDQVCALQRRADVKTILLNNTDQLEAIAELQGNVETQFNVIAIVNDEQTTVPYRPVSVKMPAMTAVGGAVLVTILVVVVILSFIVALFFFFRNKELQNRLKVELRDVHGGANGDTQTYRRVADASGFNQLSEE